MAVCLTYAKHICCDGYALSSGLSRLDMGMGGVLRAFFSDRFAWQRKNDSWSSGCVAINDPDDRYGCEDH